MSPPSIYIHGIGVLRIFWDWHELDNMEDRVDAQHRGWESQVIGMRSNWMNNWEGTEETVRAILSNIPKWALCRLYKNSGSGEMRLMG